MPPWDPTTLVDAAFNGLCAKRDALELEQAVRGVDAYDELRLHPVLARAFEAAGYAVHREQRYPADATRARKSEARRCDLVLTPGGTTLLPSKKARQQELFSDEKGVPAEDAYWLEVKSVAQFIELRPNRAWAAAHERPVFSDVVKMASDPAIRHAGLLMILFATRPDVVEHDLGVWAHRAVDRGLRFRMPLLRHAPLRDRQGNSLLACALFAVDVSG